MVWLICGVVGFLVLGFSNNCTQHLKQCDWKHLHDHFHNLMRKDPIGDWPKKFLSHIISLQSIISFYTKIPWNFNKHQYKYQFAPKLGLSISCEVIALSQELSPFMIPRVLRLEPSIRHFKTFISNKWSI